MRHDATSRFWRVNFALIVSVLVHLAIFYAVTAHISNLQDLPTTAPIVDQVEIEFRKLEPKKKIRRKPRPANLPKIKRRRTFRRRPSVELVHTRLSVQSLRHRPNAIETSRFAVRTEAKLTLSEHSPFSDEKEKDGINISQLNETKNIAPEVKKIDRHKIEVDRGFNRPAELIDPAELAHEVEAEIPQQLLPIGDTMEIIAQKIVKEVDSSYIDLVFLLDASGSMEDNIRAVGRHLKDMVKVFRENQIDFTMGVVKFKHNPLTFSQTANYKIFERLLSTMKCGGDERAYDAIVKSLERVKFRDGVKVEKRFILVTDETSKGSYSVTEVVGRCLNAGVIVDVIGVDDTFQRHLASRTGGNWFQIP